MKQLFKNISVQQQGILAVILGSTLLFGALAKQGILQNFLNIIMIVTGLLLSMWGLQKSGALRALKALKK